MKKTFFILSGLFLALDSTFAASPDRDVCFYTGRNFTGASLCLNQGERIDHLGSRGFNNKISSIEFTGRARNVLVCEESYFNGRCLEITHDMASFDDGSNFDDEITSIEVR